jgi:HK97 family phage portal protein
MGFLDKLFHRKPRGTTYAPTLDGFAPLYAQFGDNIYASDVVRQALKCIADEMKKLNPRHVRYVDSDPVPVKSTVQDVLDEPNPLMTWAEFIEKSTYLLLMNDNVFIIPIYRTWVDEKTGQERRYYEALYPITPTQVNFIQDASGRLFTEFYFYNGYQTTIPYDGVIHVRENFAVNQYMGGGIDGQPDHKALLEILKLNKTLLTGIAKAMNASYAVNGIVKYNTLINSEDTKRAIEDFNKMLQTSTSGFVPVDLKAEIQPFERKTQIVEEPTLKFIDEKILRTWGISIAILSGDYTKEQYEAFYQRCLEPTIKAFSQAMTKKLFTAREKAFGNRVELYPEDLIFMTISQKIEMVGLLSPTGGMFENEKRAAFGMPPLPELEGKRFMSLNWVDADRANEYQLGADVSIDAVSVDKEESIV